MIQGYLDIEITVEVVKVEKQGRWIGNMADDTSEYVFDQVEVHLKEYDDTINTVYLPYPMENMPTVGDRLMLGIKSREPKPTTSIREFTR